MKPKTTAVAFAFAIFCSTTLYGFQTEERQEQSDVGRILTKLVNGLHKDMGFNGVVFAAQKDQQLASIAVGTSFDPNKTALSSKTLFEIASATKPFTALAILQLSEQSKLNLDDSISKHLPGVPDNSKAISIRHLLTHTSGIPGDNYGQITDDMEAVVKSMLAGGPRTKPGSKRVYWNQGYALLSEIIARASGMSYTDYCKKNIFKPAAMKSTCFTGDQAPPGVDVAVSEKAPSQLGSQPSRTALDHPYGSYSMVYRGMGGIVTNAEDLWLWSQALVSGKLIKPETFKLMTEENDGYSIGWKIRKPENGLVSLGHNGTVRGFFTEVRIYPKTETFLFLLANNNNAQVNFEVTKYCEEAIEGRTVTAMFGLSKEQLKKFSGAGEFRGGSRVLTIFAPRSSSNFLPASINWGGPVTRGVLAQNIDGKVCFGDGNTLVPANFEFDDGGKPIACQIGKSNFKK